MSSKNTFLFGAALAVATVAIAADHVSNPVPEQPKFESGTVAASGLAPCAAGAPAATTTRRAPPPPPPARPLPQGQEAPDLLIRGEK